ncbi:hypothetical protein O181_031222 [Austropuccinia psidii MF-1]|uniref:Uncharacterized protein n=1 Tax=Austropuccinia psidii MF-1 TaxID=1389203 RepID=A0A9Q3D084_9BASI|nr:hypothetical protein [Austropuccinia psidii MF-1]
MSHQFQAPVNPQNHMRMLQLVSLNLRWLQCNPQRILLVSPHLTFLLFPAFPNPSFDHLQLVPLPPSVIIINNTPHGSPLPPLEIPPIARENPTASSPPVSSSLNPMMQLGRNLLICDLPLLFLKKLSTTQSTKSCWSISDCST